MAIITYYASAFDIVALDMTKASSQIAVLALESYSRFTEFPVAGVTFVDANSVSHTLMKDEVVNLIHNVRAQASITVATVI